MISLKSCKLPEQYTEIYKHNFKQINSIDDDCLFKNLALLISKISNIEYQIVMLELKRYLLFCHEFYPRYLKISNRNVLLIPFFLLRNIVFYITNRPLRNADIIIDHWFLNSVDNFYGVELMSKISDKYKTTLVSFQDIRFIKLSYLFSYFSKFLRCMYFARRIMIVHKIDLRRYIFSFFSEFLMGITLRESSHPKLIISGNDNGLSVIKTKSAGADTVLIQNGLRPSFQSDSSFKYSDYYFSLGGKMDLKKRQEIGCFFKQGYTFGSLRLYNFLEASKDKKFSTLYDILWVSSGDLRGNSIFCKTKYFSAEAQLEAVKIVNDFAAKTNLRVAYYLREDDEKEDLKSLGLFSNRIYYIERSEKSVYQSVMESGIILCMSSTVGFEALSLGKKVAFINLSSNRDLNAIFSGVGIEYNTDSTMPFDKFLEEVLKNNFDSRDYVFQKPNYVSDFLAVIDEAIRKYDNH